MLTNKLLNFIFISDLIFYHKFLPNNLVLTKTAVTELCLAECLFKVILHSQIIDLLPLIVYSLQKTELTLQVREYICWYL